METGVLVVGGGATGLAAARSLARTGTDVLLVDPLPLFNERNASNDESKFFRVAYGADELYTRLALAALPLWRALEAERGARILRTGGLLLPERGQATFARESERVLSRLGGAFERWDRAKLARTAPAWAPAFDGALLDVEGGLLDPRIALAALEASATSSGATVVRGPRVASLVERTEGLRATLDDGRQVRADHGLLAAGSEVGSLVPSLRRAIRATRQAELFFAPTDPSVFEPDRFPCWGLLEEGFYGFPLWNGAVKVADHRKGRPANPEDPRGTADEADEATAREFLAGALPALATAPLARSRVCLYDNTADDDFILDRLGDRIVVGVGLSGHGIKFAPLLGEILAGLVLDRAVPWDLSRFSAKRFR